MANSPALTPESTSLAIANKDVDIQTIIDGLTSDSFSASDLDRVKVPVGGGLMWEIPTAEGVQNVSEIQGVILTSMQARSYWKIAYDGASNPPDCYSTDGIKGIGNPGGECAACPWNQFETANAGTGKACKEQRTLFLLQSDAMIPLIFRMPASCLKPFKQYQLRLLRAGRNLQQVVTSFTLVKEKNRKGIIYSQVEFSVAKMLSAEEATRVKTYANALSSAFTQVHTADIRSGSAVIDAEQENQAPSGDNPFASN